MSTDLVPSVGLKKFHAATTKTPPIPAFKISEGYLTLKLNLIDPEGLMKMLDALIPYDQDQNIPSVISTNQMHITPQIPFYIRPNMLM